MSGSNRNSSQDPDYEGPVGREKRVHKNSFLIQKPDWMTKKGEEDSHEKGADARLEDNAEE